jgi:hypothetical protein
VLSPKVVPERLATPPINRRSGACRHWEGIASGSERVSIAFRLRDFEPMVTITSRFSGSGRAAVVG